MMCDWLHCSAVGINISQAIGVAAKSGCSRIAIRAFHYANYVLAVNHCRSLHSL